MSGLRGVRYYGIADTSGYGQASIAYVRALVNAGVPAQWIPIDWDAARPIGAWPASGDIAERLLALCGAEGSLSDVATLIERTSAAVAHDTVIVHSTPECWPKLFEAGRRNIGCTVWEADRAPAHWLPLLRCADRVLVPSVPTAEAFRGSGFDGPLYVVPHVRRHRWCEFSPRDLEAARSDLGIPAHHRILYTIGAWDPRKAMPELIRAFARAFTPDDSVTLLVKTSPLGHRSGPLFARDSTQRLATEAISLAAAELDRPVPPVVLHGEEIDGDAIDLFHAVGDVYVSLSHGEGWGLGAFEAATLGKPVVMTGWGGHTDYLGTDFPGAIPYRLVPAPLWPPDRPSYFPSQRWAEADIEAAVASMRAVVGDPEPARMQAMSIRERIVTDYAEPVVVTRLLEAIG